MRLLVVLSCDGYRRLCRTALFSGQFCPLAPVLAETTGASKSAASAFASASAPEHVAASKIPSDVVNSTAAATTVADRAAEADQDEKAGLSPPAKYLKPALPASHRSAPRDKKAH